MIWLSKIKKWPDNKKRTFSLSVAFILTFLIIILNSGLNIFWKEEKVERVYKENSPFISLQKRFTDIFNAAKPALDNAISSSTEIIDQINSATSSLSTTTDVVE